MGKEKNEFKENVCRIYANFTEKETCVKAFSHHIKGLKESSQNFLSEHKILRVTKKEIITFPTNRQRPKRMGNVIKLFVEGLEEQYVDIGL